MSSSSNCRSKPTRIICSTISRRMRFRVGTARALMWMSQLAYEVRDAQHKVKPVLAAMGPATGFADRRPERCSRLPLSSTRGLIATGRGATIAGFCRHRSGRAWPTGSPISISARAPATSIADLRTPLTPSGADVAAALKGADAQPLFITGHSLGGALAIIAAERLRRELKIEAAAVYTFGAPRVGSAAFAGSYNACGLGDRSYRLIHGLDIVPTLPPSSARLPSCRPDDRLRSRRPLHRRRNAVLVRLRRSAVFRHDQTRIAGSDCRILRPARSCRRHAAAGSARIRNMC